jgi:tetratricopeptide (TPR) repeat protein
MKSLFHIFLILPTALICCSGCRNPVNAYTGWQYYEAGIRAEQAGDLVKAREDYRRAYINARVGDVGAAAEAHSLYEYSRLTGHLGMYAEAEAGFTNTLVLIGKAKGQVDNLRLPTLCELARLLFDTKQYAKANPYFEKAMLEIDKNNALKADPIAFAGFIDDYAASLKAVGSDAEAETIAKRSALVKEQNPGVAAKFNVKRYTP